MGTIEKTYRIQELLTHHNRYGLTRREISRELGLPKSTCYRLLNELTSYGYVRRNGKTGRYNLGYQHLRYADYILERMEEARVCFPYLEDLHLKTQETAFYAKLSDTVCTDVVLCGFTNTEVSIARGHELPLHASAAGKVILSFLNAAERNMILGDESLSQLTAHTITDREELEEEFSRFHVTGRGFSMEEMNEGINALATPVFARGKGVVGAISLVGWSKNLDKNTLDAYADEFLVSSRKISQKLGGTFPLHLS